MAKDLIEIPQTEIVVPEDWDYEPSVDRFRNLYKEVREKGANALVELATAHEALTEDSKKKEDRKWPDKTFERYCEDIGISKDTAYRWLHKYISGYLPESSGKRNRPKSDDSSQIGLQSQGKSEQEQKPAQTPQPPKPEEDEPKEKKVAEDIQEEEEEGLDKRIRRLLEKIHLVILDRTEEGWVYIGRETRTELWGYAKAVYESLRESLFYECFGKWEPESEKERGCEDCVERFECMDETSSKSPEPVPDCFTEYSKKNENCFYCFYKLECKKAKAKVENSNGNVKELQMKEPQEASSPQQPLEMQQQAKYQTQKESQELPKPYSECLAQYSKKSNKCYKGCQYKETCIAEKEAQKRVCFGLQYDPEDEECKECNSKLCVTKFLDRYSRPIRKEGKA